MTEITCEKEKNIVRFKVKGHSESHEHGMDGVCKMCSALAGTLAISVYELTEVTKITESADGLMDIEVDITDMNEDDRHTLWAYFDMAYKGFSEIERQNPRYCIVLSSAVERF